MGPLRYALLLLLAFGGKEAHAADIAVRPDSSAQWMVNLTLGGDRRLVIFDTGQTETIVDGSPCEYGVEPGWDEAGFTVNETASPAESLNQGFGVNANVGNVAAATMGSLEVSDKQLWAAFEIYNSQNASAPPPATNPYTQNDGILGAAEYDASFCSRVIFNNTCTPSSLLLDFVHEAAEQGEGAAEAFSVFLPPFTPPGVYDGVVGTLTLGDRRSDFEAGLAAVTVPRADELGAMQAAFAAGTSGIVNGKWWFAADDVLVNGVSTGACAAGPNNTLGKCLIFTDTGMPYVSVDPQLLTSDQQAAFAAWLDEESYNPAFPYDYCDELSAIPLNLTISVGGLLLSVTPPDMAFKQMVHNGRDFCSAMLFVRSAQAGFDNPSDPFYALPAPAVFAGNIWLRNFYVTHSLRTTASAASMTLGCALDGLGKCTTA